MTNAKVRASAILYRVSHLYMYFAFSGKRQKLGLISSLTFGWPNFEHDPWPREQMQGCQRTDAGTDRSSVTEPSVLIKLKELFKYNLNAPMNLPQVRNQTVWSRQQDHENEPCGKSHKKWSRSFESEDTSEQMLLLYFLLSNGVFSLTINDAKSLSTPDENCP